MRDLQATQVAPELDSGEDPQLTCFIFSPIIKLEY